MAGYGSVETSLTELPSASINRLASSAVAAVTHIARPENFTQK
jgi:hypothetical protein